MRLVRKFFPNFSRRLTGDDGTNDQYSLEGKKPDYFTFEAKVGRNSRIVVLSEDEIEELGGVEYRALTALMWIVAAVSFRLHISGLALTTLAVLVRSSTSWIHDYRTIHVHVEVETRPLHARTAQGHQLRVVFLLLNHICVWKHGDVVSRPVHDPLSESVPDHLRYGISHLRWEHRVPCLPSRHGLDHIQAHPKGIALERDAAFPARSSAPVLRISFPCIPNMVSVCSHSHTQVSPFYPKN